MKKDKVYLWSFLSLLLVVFLTGYFSFSYLLNVSTERLISVQMASSKREAREMARMVSNAINDNIPKETIITNVQNSIEDTELDAGFLCMFDSTGKEICHPDPEKIGQVILPGQSYVNENNDFYDYLTNKKEGGGKRNFKDSSRNSEVVYLYPVKNSEWVIASHANITVITEQLNEFKTRFFLVYGIASGIIVILSLLMVRFIGSRYERQLENKNEELMGEVLNLAKLNSDIEAFREQNTSHNPTTEAAKKRILTHKQNELIPIDVVNIAYIYTENSATYIKCIDGITSYSNNSLDELYNTLDQGMFFRANRQVIISVNAVSKIIRYGNNQLKILVTPESDIDIIISKNKAAEFKKWLNQEL